MEENTLGQYRIIREAGKGGMGIIYKGLDPRTQKSVAIKVLPPMMVDRVTVERFHREVQAMIKLKHPNMIEVIDSGMEKGKHFLIMEFVEGENVKTIVKSKGPLPVKQAMEITAQVADALSHMHKQGMIHRDIKPANIMLTPEGRVKVMDYGLVKMMGVTSVTVDGTSLGTAEYMSPEQISGDGVDARTDIYSLGITLYEMLAGKPPFSGESMQELLLKHKSENAVPLRQQRPDIPAEAEWIVTKAMAKGLNDRYQTVEAMLADVRKLAPEPTGSTGLTNVGKPETGRSTQRKISAERKPPAQERPKRHYTPNYNGVIVFFVLVVWAGAVIIYREKIFDFIKEKPWTKTRVMPADTNLLGEAENSLRILEEAEVHFEKGKTYARQGRPDRAIREFRTAIRLRDDHPSYYRELAIAYEARNEHKNAVNAWTDLLRYSSDMAEVEEAQKSIQRLGGKR